MRRQVKGPVLLVELILHLQNYDNTSRELNTLTSD